MPKPIEMHQPDPHRAACRLRRCAAALISALISALACAAAGADGGAADSVAFRHRADIVVTQPGPYVELPLPASVYSRSEQAGLRDIRLVDALGARVPFAFLPAPPPGPPANEPRLATTLYPLPPRSAVHEGQPPLDIRIEAGRIRIRQAGDAGPASNPAAAQPPAGWLIDLGPDRIDGPSNTGQPRKPGQARTLELNWAKSADFNAVFDLATSADLRSWREAGSGQLMALQTAGSVLKLDRVPLPEDAGRYVRLSWVDASQAPRLIAAWLVPQPIPAPSPGERSATLQVDATAAAASADPGGRPGFSADHESAHALQFDLGGVMPIERIDLQLPAGTWVAPVRWAGRQRSHDAWQTLGAQVHHRLERNGSISRSAPLTVNAQARYLRMVTDERVSPPDAKQVRVEVQVALASLVFASQGRPPYTLLAGERQVAGSSALPLATLIADIEAQRAQFGRAHVAAWSEDADVSRATEERERLASLRPWLLWGVLLAGVGGLGVMVWQLARGARPKPD